MPAPEVPPEIIGDQELKPEELRTWGALT